MSEFLAASFPLPNVGELVFILTFVALIYSATRLGRWADRLGAVFGRS